jgi:hypothetical protein
MSAHDATAATRAGLASAFAWEAAHVTFDAAVKGLPAKLRGRRPVGLPYSPWELVEHLRLAQHDLLDFCRNPNYQAPSWPADYWPGKPAPPSAEAWAKSLRAYRRDRAAFAAFVRNPAHRLQDRIPHGNGQTYLREALLAIDHSAYHVGQLVAVRRALGAWGK